jgi:hypothetical protein
MLLVIKKKISVFQLRYGHDIYSQSVSQSVNLDVEPHLRLMTRYLLLFDSCGLIFVGFPV